MDDNQIIRFVEWFQEKWSQATLYQIEEICFPPDEKGLQVFCPIGRYQVLIRLIISSKIGLYEHTMAIDPEPAIFCDKFKISSATNGIGIVIRLYKIRPELIADVNPIEICRRHLAEQIPEFHQNPGYFEKIIESTSKRPGKQIPMYRGGAPGLGKKR